MGKDDIFLIGGEVAVSRDAFTALLDRYHSKRVVLFGSAARGEITPANIVLRKISHTDSGQ